MKDECTPKVKIRKIKNITRKSNLLLIINEINPQAEILATMELLVIMIGSQRAMVETIQRKKLNLHQRLLKQAIIQIIIDMATRKL